MKAMMKFLSTLWIIFSIVHFSVSKPDVLVKRELDNYDQIAMSVCASLTTATRRVLVYPVRRQCPSSDNCDRICKSPEVIAQLYSWATGSPACVESLHFYKRRAHLAPDTGNNVDVNRVGLVTKRYYSCHVTGCGPNYCCCRKG